MFVVNAEISQIEVKKTHFDELVFQLIRVVSIIVELAQVIFVFDCVQMQRLEFSVFFLLNSMRISFRLESERKQQPSDMCFKFEFV